MQRDPIESKLCKETSQRPGAPQIARVNNPAFSPSPLVISPKVLSESMRTNPKTAAPIDFHSRDEDPAARRRVNRWSMHGSEFIIDGSTWDFKGDLNNLQIRANVVLVVK